MFSSPTLATFKGSTCCRSRDRQCRRPAERSEEAVQGSRHHVSDRREPAAIRRSDGFGQSRSRRVGPGGLERLYSAPEKDIFALQGRIADGVSHAGPIGTSGAAQTRDSKLGTSDVEALSRRGGSRSARAAGHSRQPPAGGHAPEQRDRPRSEIRAGICAARRGALGDLSGHERNEMGDRSGDRHQQGAHAGPASTGSLDLTRADPPGHRAAGRRSANWKRRSSSSRTATKRIG